MFEMKAVGLTRYLPIDDPQALVDVELPQPVPGPRDLLVKVEAISVNPVDTKVRAPKPQVEEAPRVLGWDAAGTVVAVGADVTLFRPGDAVFYAGSITRPARTANSMRSTSGSPRASRSRSISRRPPRCRSPR
jgi:NADPH:quinone reductase-like Zn-dependent oxidoreductase